MTLNDVMSPLYFGSLSEMNILAYCCDKHQGQASLARTSQNKTAIKINKQAWLDPVFNDSIVVVVCLQSLPDPPCTGH